MCAIIQFPSRRYDLRQDIASMMNSPFSNPPLAADGQRFFWRGSKDPQTGGTEAPSPEWGVHTCPFSCTLSEDRRIENPGEVVDPWIPGRLESHCQSQKPGDNVGVFPRPVHTLPWTGGTSGSFVFQRDLKFNLWLMSHACHHNCLSRCYFWSRAHPNRTDDSKTTRIIPQELPNDDSQ